jgi:hypothetical protein
MLERPVLFLRPPAGPAARAIADGESGTVVGFARRVPPEAVPWWRRLVGPVELAVHEKDDEPLVFTVRRAWGLWPRREVRDADGHTVGSLRAGAVLDSRGRPVAAIEGDGGGRVFRGRGGDELAVVSPVTGGLRVAFHPGVRDPFLRMLLLAAALDEP